jgi:7-cyano-7-deazaguanine synthase
MTRPEIGVLASGGLDSCIMLARFLQVGHPVQPFYIRSQLRWESAELRALESFLAAVSCDHLRNLVVLDLPLADLYADHWSITGRGVPATESPDKEVFLPGRNALLVVKASIWCQLHGIPQLALALLGTSPFEDASDVHVDSLERAYHVSDLPPVHLLSPFRQFGKRTVMQMGRQLPLELTLSCLAPVGDEHCGYCNKCAERQAAFRDAGLCDATTYASRDVRTTGIPSRPSSMVGPEESTYRID